MALLSYSLIENYRKKRIIHRIFTLNPSFYLTIILLFLICAYYSRISFLLNTAAVFTIIYTFIYLFRIRKYYLSVPTILISLFLIPIPSSIRLFVSLPLQEFTAQLIGITLEIFNQDFEHNGAVIFLKNKSVTITEGCNGLKFFISLILIAFFVISRFNITKRQIYLLLVFSPICSILLNYIRLLPTTLLYIYADKPTADNFHDIFGIIMLSLAWLIPSLFINQTKNKLSISPSKSSVQIQSTKIPLQKIHLGILLLILFSITTIHITNTNENIMNNTFYNKLLDNNASSNNYTSINIKIPQKITNIYKNTKIYTRKYTSLIDRSSFFLTLYYTPDKKYLSGHSAKKCYTSMGYSITKINNSPQDQVKNNLFTTKYTVTPVNLNMISKRSIGERVINFTIEPSILIPRKQNTSIVLLQFEFQNATQIIMHKKMTSQIISEINQIVETHK